MKTLSEQELAELKKELNSARKLNEEKSKKQKEKRKSKKSINPIKWLIDFLLY